MIQQLISGKVNEMALITDEVMEEVLQSRNSKIWQFLDDSQMVGLVRKDGGIDYICAGAKSGVFIFREEELYSFKMLYEIADCRSGLFLLDDDPTLDEKTQFHLSSYLQVFFESKKDVNPEWAKTIDRYKKKKGIRLYGPKNYFTMFKILPQHIPSVWIDKDDQKRVAEAFRLLNWLSRHPEKIGPYGMWGQNGLDKVCVYKPMDDGSYEKSVIEGPRNIDMPFPCVPFAYEVLARQVASLISHKEDDLLQCNLFMPEEPVPDDYLSSVENPDDTMSMEEIQSHLGWPWLFMAGAPYSGRVFYMKAVRKVDEEILRDLAQAMIYANWAPCKIEVQNTWTYRLLKDFCEKTGINLVLSDDLWIEDACEEFLEKNDPMNRENQEDDEDDGLLESISMLRKLSDKELMALPAFIRRALREAYSELPEDLQKRCARLWKWKV